MALLFIHTINSTIHAFDHGNEYDRPEHALQVGVQSAIAMLAEEINQGSQNAAVEIRIDDEDGTAVLRSAVSVCVSPLLIVESRKDLAGENA